MSTTDATPVSISATITAEQPAQEPSTAEQVVSPTTDCVNPDDIQISASEQLAEPTAAEPTAAAAKPTAAAAKPTSSEPVPTAQEEQEKQETTPNPAPAPMAEDTSLVQLSGKKPRVAWLRVQHRLRLRSPPAGLDPALAREAADLAAHRAFVAATLRRSRELVGWLHKSPQLALAASLDEYYHHPSLSGGCSGSAAVDGIDDDGTEQAQEEDGEQAAENADDKEEDGEQAEQGEQVGQQEEDVPTLEEDAAGQGDDREEAAREAAVAAAAFRAASERAGLASNAAALALHESEVIAPLERWLGECDAVCGRRGTGGRLRAAVDAALLADHYERKLEGLRARVARDEVRARARADAEAANGGSTGNSTGDGNANFAVSQAARDRIARNEAKAAQARGAAARRCGAVVAEMRAMNAARFATLAPAVRGLGRFHGALQAPPQPQPQRG